MGLLRSSKTGSSNLLSKTPGYTLIENVYVGAKWEGIQLKGYSAQTTPNLKLIRKE